MVMTVPLKRQELGLSGAALGFALSAKYSILLTYGLWAAYVELPTFVLVGSSMFATGWALTVATFAALALVGILRTWFTGKYRVEKWATAILICVFLGYSFALVKRSVETEMWNATPTALLPLALCILPAIRFYSFVPKKKAKA